MSRPLLTRTSFRTSSRIWAFRREGGGPGGEHDQGSEEVGAMKPGIRRRAAVVPGVCLFDGVGAATARLLRIDARLCSLWIAVLCVG